MIVSEHGSVGECNNRIAVCVAPVQNSIKKQPVETTTISEFSFTSIFRMYLLIQFDDEGEH